MNFHVNAGGFTEKIFPMIYRQAQVCKGSLDKQLSYRLEITQMLTNQLRFVSEPLCQLREFCSSKQFSRNQSMTNTWWERFVQTEMARGIQICNRIFERIKSKAIHTSNDLFP